MGLYSDILEDNLERTGQYLDVLVLPPRPIRGGDITPHVTPLIHCPLCGEVIITDIDLKRHFLGKHANRYAYLLVDGNIIRDAIYADSKISSIIAHLINIPRAQIRIEASGMLPVVRDFAGTISIMEHLHGFHAGEINIITQLSHMFKRVYLSVL